MATTNLFNGEPLPPSSVTDSVTSTLTGATWTCTSSTAATCNPSAGAGDLDTTVISTDFSSSVNMQITGTVLPSMTGPLVNTVTIHAPAGYTFQCAGQGFNPTTSCSATATLNPASPQLTLSITKTGGPNPYVPGQTVTYTITVDNGGPFYAVGSTVTDVLPAELTGVTWTCKPSSNSSCTLEGSGNIDDTVTIASGGSVVYMVIGTVAPGTTGPITNTATVTPASDQTATCEPADCSAEFTLEPGTADLAVAKTVKPMTAGVGQTVTFTVGVTNNGPDTATGVTVSDTLPAGLTFDSASPSQGSYAGGVWDVGTLSDGQKATLDIVATAASPGSHTNTATITHSDQTDSNPDNNSASATVTVTEAATPTPTPTPSAPGQPSVPGQPSTPGLPNTGGSPGGLPGGGSPPAFWLLLLGVLSLVALCAWGRRLAHRG